MNKPRESWTEPPASPADETIIFPMVCPACGAQATTLDPDDPAWGWSTDFARWEHKCVPAPALPDTTPADRAAGLAHFATLLVARSEALQTEATALLNLVAGLAAVPIEAADATAMQARAARLFA